MKIFTEKTLSSGKVVPGFGHAVLRKTVRTKPYCLQHPSRAFLGVNTSPGFRV